MGNLMSDPEVVKGFLTLGGMGILGVIMYFQSRASDKRLDIMLEQNSKERQVWHEDSAKERELWRQTINALNTNILDNTHEVKRVDCLIPKRRR